MSVGEDIAPAVRRRLLDHARAHGDDFQRLLVRYAIERLLYRLSRTEAAERYMLKGAMLFATWSEQAIRPTGDLDLLGGGDPSSEAIAELFRAICAAEVAPDGIVFDPATISIDPVREAETYRGVQLSLKALLAKATAIVRVDIGFGDHVHPAPKLQIFPTLFDDMPAARVLMYPPETVIAEKFEAMISIGMINSRVKDFYDLWIATRTFSFEMSPVVEAVTGTLHRRATPLPERTPIGLAAEFAARVADRGYWTGFLRRTAPVIKPPAFEELQAELRGFFDPVITMLARPDEARGTWDRDRRAWV
ncbi:nucleotidyl transferase AbiEii/AbiGii toxin family protein [Sphingomonas sp. RT2P30]|uniref:nucleotidyl transferase AbiEii/AbiGii toxin family protein n=1 Tax=Parasphingomonas halimpatiens TaxID=3096162 RepID=UPI002FC83FC5